MKKTARMRILTLLMTLLLLLTGCGREDNLPLQTEGNRFPVPVDRELYFGMTLAQVINHWGEPETAVDTPAHGGQELTYTRQVLGVSATVKLGVYPMEEERTLQSMELHLPAVGNQEQKRLVTELVREIEETYGENEGFSWLQKPEESGEALSGAFAIDLGQSGFYGTITADETGIVLLCYNVD